MTKVAMLLLLVSVALGQVFPTNPYPTNVDFSEGEIGTLPPGWHIPEAVLNAGYRAELRRQECRAPFSGCVLYLPPVRIGDVARAELQQTFQAGPYLGKSVRFSAWLHMQGPAGGNIELRMRVDRVNRKVDFFDSVAPPVDGAEWQMREVIGVVSADAVSISIWARYHPPGLAWISAPSFGVVEPQDHAADENVLAVRALIGKFSDLRNAHDGVAVAALYTEDGEWSTPNGLYSTHGRAALATLWGGVLGRAERAVESVDFPEADTALVLVAAQFDEPIGLLQECFIAVKKNGTWYIRRHQLLE